MIEPGNNHLAAALAAALHDSGAIDRSATVEGLERLSGGANMETWMFEVCSASHNRRLVLRRRPGGILQNPAPDVSDAMLPNLSLATEAELLTLARRTGVPVPGVVMTHACSLQDVSEQDVPDFSLGDALVLSHVAGEALPQRLLRDERYASARQRLAFQCGEALAKIHSIALEALPAGLRDLTWAKDIARLQNLCDEFGNVSPAHQLAVNWLAQQPAPQSPRVLCHGDFRMGNLIVNDSGLAAVLDWELAHIGHAGEDLGYLCAQVWRFGGKEPAAGVGSYQELLDGYRSVKGAVVELGEVLMWELYAALGWGLVCLTMLELHERGIDPGLERAAVGRRLGESEVDILRLLDTLQQ